MTAENTHDSIAQAFCEDCHNRMLRVSEIVRDGVPLTRVQLDQLHQEFDTLYGGARAVHLPKLEHFFRSMERYARHLRKLQDSGKKVDPLAWQLLLSGIEIGLDCGGELSCCFMHGDNDQQQLLQNIKNIINQGGVA